MERTMNYREAAEVLGCSEGTLRQWVMKKHPGLRWLKIGRLVRFRPSDLSAFMERCQVPESETTVESQANTSDRGPRR